MFLPFSFSLPSPLFHNKYIKYIFLKSHGKTFQTAGLELNIRPGGRHLTKFQNVSMLVTATCPLVPLISSRSIHGYPESVAAMYIECTGPVKGAFSFQVFRLRETILKEPYLKSFTIPGYDLHATSWTLIKCCNGRLLAKCRKGESIFWIQKKC